MIYIYVIASAVVIVSALLAGRSRIRRHNVRRIVHRMGKRGMQPVDENENLMTHAPRSARAAAIEMHQARKLLRDADRELKKGDTALAERHLIGAITSAPEDTEAQIQLGLLYLSTQRPQKARAVFEPLANRHADPILWGHLARTLSLQNEWSEASMACRKALDLDPSNPHLQADAGTALLHCSAYEEAASFLEQAVTQLPRRIDLLRLLAECYEKNKKPEAARTAYRRINRLDPRDMEVREKIAATAK